MSEMSEEDGMKEKNANKGLNRRDFLKIGIAGTTSVILGSSGLSGAVQNYVPSSFSFPKPVYRTLGRTGIRPTIVSFGAMLTPEAEVIALAIENGVNYIDTARKYMDGRNEEIVGRAIKGKRDKVFLATKTLPTSTSKEDIVKDVETSLRTLRTDYIDIIQLHNLTGKERIFVAETREALTALRKQGKVRFFGVTTHKNQAEVLNALVDEPDRFFDTALVAYNFKSSKEERQAIARAAKANIGIIAMKTQAGGYETKELGGISPHQAALKWVLQDANVSNAIPGMKDLAMLKEDIAVMGMPFTYTDARILERYDTAIQPYYCHMCGKCEGTCLMGVEISTVNRSLMYADGYRNVELAQATYREIPADVSASACLDCTGCTAQCVNGLDIAAKMARARRILA